MLSPSYLSWHDLQLQNMSACTGISMMHSPFDQRSNHTWDLLSSLLLRSSRRVSFQNMCHWHQLKTLTLHRRWTLSTRPSSVHGLRHLPMDHSYRHLNPMAVFGCLVPQRCPTRQSEVVHSLPATHSMHLLQPASGPLVAMCSPPPTGPLRRRHLPCPERSRCESLEQLQSLTDRDCRATAT